MSSLTCHCASKRSNRWPSKWIAASKLTLLLAMTILSACQATGGRTGAILPSSERLEGVRRAEAPGLAAEMHEAGFRYGAPVFIRIFKKERRLESWVMDDETGRFEAFKVYPICKFSGGLGPKLREGDMQSPEGFYNVGAEQLNPNSAYHLSFNLGFPNQYDRARGRTGSLLMVHGGCKSEGCYAMSDPAIEEIYLLIEASIAGGADVPVHIFPFRMNEGNIYANFDPLWITFWRNLQEGHDIFERSGVPPETAYAYGGAGQHRHKYVFQDQTNLIAQLSKEFNR
ncbi:MAG: 2-dehydro-3-deoxyphosphooctonate aldolase [Micavibrio sp.]|nr:2-dehydro-3-deoxyphosphooctonate aldolase [Micavibrio sp.]